MSEEPSALEARGLTKRYRDVVALSECSFQLPAHRIIALVGGQRRGQVHADEHRRRAAAGHQR